MIAIACTAGCLHASMITVDSQHDGTGGYRYSFTSGSEALVWGGDSNMITVVIPSYQVMDVSAPPGWVADTNAAHRVVMRYARTNTWFAQALPMQVDIHSAVVTPIEYDSFSADALYPCGTVQGAIYTTNGALFTAAATNHATSVNVVGFERFALTGPTIPEPAVCIAVLVGVGASRRQRR